MIPNILTTVRLILVPVFAYFLIGAQNSTAAIIAFVLSGITDIVDGYVARHYNMITNFGKVYDPLVDKLMQITVVICLVVEKIIPVWLLVFVMVKEVTMIIIGGILYLRKIVVSSNWSGKVATVVFYAAVITMIIWKHIPAYGEIIVFSIMVASMVLAAVCYVIDTVKNYDKKRIC